MEEGDCQGGSQASQSIESPSLAPISHSVPTTPIPGPACFLHRTFGHLMLHAMFVFALVVSLPHQNGRADRICPRSLEEHAAVTVG